MGTEGDAVICQKDNKSILGQLLLIEFAEDSPYLLIIMSYRAVIATSHVPQAFRCPRERHHLLFIAKVCSMPIRNCRPFSIA